MSAYVSPECRDRKDAVMIGMDVGSTTVKAVVVDPLTKQILWSDYQRHQTKQAEFVYAFLQAIGEAFPGLSPQQFRMFITGSGASPIAPHVNAKFVQEVNAVTLAVEHYVVERNAMRTLKVGGGLVVAHQQLDAHMGAGEVVIAAMLDDIVAVGDHPVFQSGFHGWLTSRGWCSGCLWA